MVDPDSERWQDAMKSEIESTKENQVWNLIDPPDGVSKVNLTGGNRSGLTGYRSNRSGPVPVPAGTQPAKIQILNLNSKNEKFPKNS